MATEYFVKLWDNNIIQLGIWQTVYMTALTTIFAYLIGLPLGVILWATDKDGLHPNKGVNTVLGFIVNFFRSIPAVILMVAMIPAAKLLLGTSTGNGAVFHHGPAASKYTGGTSKGGSSDCEPEFIAQIRKIMDEGDVTWQMAELRKMEKGGGGTIAQYMSRFGMAVLDMGTPLWNMHAPWELAAKDDCWNTYKAYSAYLRA